MNNIKSVVTNTFKHLNPPSQMAESYKRLDSANNTVRKIAERSLFWNMTKGTY